MHSLPQPSTAGIVITSTLQRRKLRVGSVQFSRSVVSDSLRPHGWQHTRPHCASPTPGVYSNSCPLSQWCHPTISSSVIPFSSRLQSSAESVSFPMSELFASGGQSFGVSASASVLQGSELICPSSHSGRAAKLGFQVYIASELSAFSLCIKVKPMTVFCLPRRQH